ncbi:hypothetical protein BABINDRAFT_160235 [Babjeviella inositovora NRRL Y-12698]|uniref:Uncharacterized protein n=1 Tax=Babjeviella inositovora NRRL Y-12698 TaxID=984486 RepID=A0A1E3QWH0_9ASCO|nr:uncharacterized protein BABINDRAFT_160235 [Babjeviella inositovora NRRL Y-12698]ODQ82025.1 hypothetical protein BABINDRAFT_160235 [Babjeviella inositovora NRRL Y-12698]
MWVRKSDVLRPERCVQSRAWFDSVLVLLRHHVFLQQPVSELNLVFSRSLNAQWLPGTGFRFVSFTRYLRFSSSSGYVS